MNLRRLDPAALMYHELRAPLGLVATAARSVADDIEDDDVRERCEVIIRAAERMLRTAATVVDLDREAGAFSSFLPVPVAEELVQTLAGLGVPLDLHVTAAAETPASGTAARFEALLHSMISNALDHGEPGRPIAVTVAVGREGLTVDIANDIALHDGHRGRGLGMLIAAALARGLGARIESSETDERYVTRITLPAPLERGHSGYGDSLSTQSA